MLNKKLLEFKKKLEKITGIKYTDKIIEEYKNELLKYDLNSLDETQKNILKELEKDTVFSILYPFYSLTIASYYYKFKKETQKILDIAIKNQYMNIYKIIFVIDIVGIIKATINYLNFDLKKYNKQLEKELKHLYDKDINRLLYLINILFNTVSWKNIIKELYYITNNLEKAIEIGFNAIKEAYNFQNKK